MSKRLLTIVLSRFYDVLKKRVESSIRIAVLEGSLHVSPQPQISPYILQAQPDCEGAELHWASRCASTMDFIVCGI